MAYFYGCDLLEPGAPGCRYSNEAELRCVEWKSGKVMWSASGLDRTSLLYIDSHLVCLGEYGLVTLLKVNPMRFQPVAQMTISQPRKGAGESESLLRYPCWASPIVCDGLMYLRGERRLVCVEITKKDKP